MWFLLEIGILLALVSWVAWMILVSKKSNNPSGKE